MKHDSNDLPNELKGWFQSVQQLTEASFFRIAKEGPHRGAVALDVMRRNARTVFEAKLDSDGKLYSPICFFLAAACWQLNTNLEAGHWRAALDNVRDLRASLESTPSDSFDLGLDIGTPETLFKGEFDEAIRQSGLIDGATSLSEEDRQVALGLAVNWAIRLLLAYSLEATSVPPPSGRRDFAWLAEKVKLSMAGQTR